MSEHTPGPWYVHNVDDDYFMNAYVVSTSQGDPDVSPDERTNSHKDIIAITLLQTPRVVDHASTKWLENARLIAAAPDLLAACEAFIKRQDAPVGTNPLQLAADAKIAVDLAHAAIAKARGL